MSRKIYVVGSAQHYTNWMEGTVAKDIPDSDLVVFTGGEDVSPELYGEPSHNTTQSNYLRDRVEQFAFKVALGLGKRMIGICRGSQFLCVMAGGKLVQHQDNPGYVHGMFRSDGEPMIAVTSTHHQAQYPWNLDDVKLLGWTHDASYFHFNGRGEEIINDVPKTMGIEVEIAYYPSIKALAIQSHPEMVYPPVEKWSKDYISYCQDLLNKHMEDKL